MIADEIMRELQGLGQANIKRIFLNHGIQEPLFGVKVEDLKKIQKRIKKDYELSLALYDTGNYDAMYLAGLIADDVKMTKRDLQRWVKQASSAPLCGFTVAWIATESRYGHELALKWIDSRKESIAVAGWATLGGLVSITEDAELDLPELEQLLARVEESIHDAAKCVRYAMNNFVICVGTYVEPLAARAMRAAKKIGKVTVDMGDTSCKVPFAPDYIEKARSRGPVKKRKTVKC